MAAHTVDTGTQDLLASLEDGVLTLTLPKTADAKPKQIRIGSTPEITSGPDAA